VHPSFSFFLGTRAPVAGKKGKRSSCSDREDAPGPGYRRAHWAGATFTVCPGRGPKTLDRGKGVYFKVNRIPVL